MYLGQVLRLEWVIIFIEHISRKIPEKFICQISQQLIDESCYLKGNDDVKYNLPHLKYWLYQQNAMQNPFTRQGITTSDIIYDYKLKQ